MNCTGVGDTGVAADLTPGAESAALPFICCISTIYEIMQAWILFFLIFLMKIKGLSSKISFIFEPGNGPRIEGGGSYLPKSTPGIVGAG
jgi:hypothetical protein